MEEKAHFTQTRLPALIAAVCSFCKGSKAAAIATLSFSLIPSHAHTHSHILLSFVVPIYRQMVASLLLSSSCT